MAAMTASPPRHADEGFTLIEALVALTLLAVAIGLLQSAMTGAARLGARAGGDTAALEIAQAQLAAAGVAVPLSEGVTEGDAAGGYRWRLIVARHGPPARTADGSADQGPAGYWTTAEVEWQEHGRNEPRKVRLTTLKLGNWEARP